MFDVLHRSDQRQGAIAAFEFEGEPYGAGISFFVGDLEPARHSCSPDTAFRQRGMSFIEVLEIANPMGRTHRKAIGNCKG